MNFLNPHAKVKRESEIKAKEENRKNKDARLKTRRGIRKANRKHGRTFISSYHKELAGANAKTEADYKEYVKTTKVGKDAMKEIVEEEAEEVTTKKIKC